MILVALFLVTLTLPSLISHASSLGTTGPVSFVSDTNWQVYNTDSALGPGNTPWLRPVCVPNHHHSFILPCRGYDLWTQYWGLVFRSFSSIPGAHWIWAPGINGTTTPAEFNQSYFSKTFELNGTKPIGLISISADDFAEVRVNGHVVGNIGSVSDFSTATQAQASMTTFNLTPFLRSCTNILTVRAENGPFGICCPSNYSYNPVK